MTVRSIALFASLLLAACGGGEHDDPSAETTTVPPVAEPLVSTAPPEPEVEAGATVAVVLEDNTIGLPADGVPPGPVVFTVSNAGEELHSLAIEGPGVNVRLESNLGRNEESSLEATFVPGSYRAWCPLHEDEPGEEVQFQVEAPE